MPESFAPPRAPDLAPLSYGRARTKGLTAKVLVIPYGWDVGAPYEEAYAPVLDQVRELLDGQGMEAEFMDMVGHGEGHRPIDRIRVENPDLIVCLGIGYFQASDVIATIWPFRREIPIALWAYPPYEASGKRWNQTAFCAGYVTKGALEELGVPFFFLREHADSPETLERLRRYSRVAVAKRRLELTRVGMFGYVSWGMYSAMADPQAILRHFGCEVEIYDQSSLIEEMGTIGEQEALEYARQEVSGATLAASVNDSHLISLGRMTLALRGFVVRDELDAVTVKCHTELSHDYGCSACVPLSLLGDELDTMCESDIPQVITHLAQRYLTGLPPVHADVQDARPGSGIACGGCGLSPFCLSPKAVLAPWSFHYGGLQVISGWKRGPVTLARLGRLPESQGFRMHIARGTINDEDAIPGELYGNETVAGAWVELEGDQEEFLDRAISNHYAIVWGDCVDDLKELCATFDVTVMET